MATKIVVDHLFGTRVGQRQQFDPCPRLRFGRHPENEVVFDAHKDLDASTRHAELRQEDTRWVLLDVGSSNGTIVDGAKISRQDLTPGVPVEIEFGVGGPRVRLYIGDPEDPRAAPPIVAGSKSGKIGLRRAGPPAEPPDEDLAHAATVAADSGRGSGGVAAAATDASRHGGVASAVSAASGSPKRPRAPRWRVALVVLAAVVLGVVSALVLWNVTVARSAGSPDGAGGAATGAAGPRIVDASRDALYLFAFVGEDGTDTALCSGFAVGRRLVATHARCADRMNELRTAGRDVFAVRNGDARARLHPVSIVTHPGYRAAASETGPDVALVELDAELPRSVRLATGAELDAVKPGVALYAYGFPGPLARPAAPEATLTSGTIGRIDGVVLQHSAFTMDGTSGSPVFDASGAVIGMDTGSYVREKAPRQGEEMQDTGNVASGLSGYNVAIRSDVVGELMRAKGVQRAP